MSSEASRRILVADDDPAILRLVTAIVEKEGYTVVPARDGREAYQLLQKGGDFLACVFDVVMPHIQGPELVRYMKTEKKLMKIPVMMMTAEQNPKLSSDSFSAGAVRGCGGMGNGRDRNASRESPSVDPQTPISHSARL